jgi:hypothetical protein
MCSTSQNERSIYRAQRADLSLQPPAASSLLNRRLNRFEFKVNDQMNKIHIPDFSEFPVGTRFVIYEFDVPLAQVPQEEKSVWINWFGGKPKPYDAGSLTVSNNWTAESFEEWIGIVRDSMTL